MAPANKPPRKPRAKAPAKRTGGGGYKPAIDDAARERLVSMLALGTPVGIACDASGVSSRTYHRYIADAEELREAAERAEAEGLPAPKLNAIQQQKLALLASVEKARAEAVPRALAQIAQAAAGGAKEIEVVNEYTSVTHPDGTVTVELTATKRKERTVRGTWQAAAWQLERGWPEHFARTERHELSGPDGGPVESVVAIGAKALEDPAVQAGVDALLESAAGE